MGVLLGAAVWGGGFGFPARFGIRMSDFAVCFSYPELPSHSPRSSWFPLPANVTPTKDLPVVQFVEKPCSDPIRMTPVRRQRNQGTPPSTGRLGHGRFGSWRRTSGLWSGRPWPGHWVASGKPVVGLIENVLSLPLAYHCGAFPVPHLFGSARSEKRPWPRLV